MVVEAPDVLGFLVLITKLILFMFVLFFVGFFWQNMQNVYGT